MDDAKDQVVDAEAQAKVEAMAKKIAQMQARLQKEKAKITQKARKRETQRKILLGSVLVKKLDDNHADAAETKRIRKWCYDRLTEKDKARFNGEKAKKPAANTQTRVQTNSSQQPEKATS